jgi:carbon starvation protein
MFGWLPALIWILAGSILIGGVHDFTALVASIRHKARSIAEVVREHMSRRAFVLFLTFVWLALVYIIVAFTDITAGAFVKNIVLEGADRSAGGGSGGSKITILGGGIASSSLMYLALPIIMGLVMRYTKLTIGWATAIFIPLVGVSIWLGQSIPFDLTALLKPSVTVTQAQVAEFEAELITAYTETHPEVALTESLKSEVTQNSETRLIDIRAARLAHKTWDVLLLIYCCIASVVPMWLLLQPRGHLGGYFLYIALAGGALGLIFSGSDVLYPGFIPWDMRPEKTREPLFPVLFITIACGACSGFHALIASGTTSKQLRYETDAKMIGYGAMLLEAMVAIVSLCCVMRLARGSIFLDPKTMSPDQIYATGIGSFLEVLGLPGQLGIAFALMAFTTFVYDTLDVCTRLGRYIIQELTGWHDAKGRWLGTLLTGGVPAFFIMQTINGPDGKPAPLWRIFWNLFGASNQLLAALTLLGVTVWLWRTRRAVWVLFVAGIPTLFMYVMSTWALSRMILANIAQLQKPNPQSITYVLLGISSLLVILALAMLVEAVIALTHRDTDQSRPNAPAPALATG